MKFTEEELKKIAEKANNVLGDNEAYITARIGKDGTFECNAAGTTETILRTLIDTAAQLFINAENIGNHAEIIEMINDIPRMIKRQMIKMQIEQFIHGLADSLDEPEEEE